MKKIFILLFFIFLGGLFLFAYSQDFFQVSLPIEIEKEGTIAISERGTEEFKEIFEEKTNTIVYKYIPQQENVSFSYEVEYAIFKGQELVFFDVISFPEVSKEKPLFLELEKMGVEKWSVKIIIRDNQGELVYQAEKSFGS